MKAPHLHKPKQITSVLDTQSDRDIGNLLEKVDKVGNLLEKVDKVGDLIEKIDTATTLIVTKADEKAKELPQRISKKDVTCWTCSQLVHLSIDCPKRSEEVKEKSAKNSSKRDRQLLR